MQIMSFILAVCMVISLLPMTALAVSWTWNVTLAGTNITSGGYYKVSGSALTADGSAEDYNAHFDSASKTLYLNNFVYSAASSSAMLDVAPSDGNKEHSTANKDVFNIVLTGTNSLTKDASKYTGHGIVIGDSQSYTALSTLNISGGGSLEVTAYGGNGIYGGLAVTGSGTTVTFNAGSTYYVGLPLVLEGDLSVKNGAALNVNALNSSGYYIWRGTGIDIDSSSSFTAKCNTGSEYAALYSGAAIIGMPYKYSTDGGANWTEAEGLETPATVKDISGSSTSGSYPAMQSDGTTLANCVRLSGVTVKAAYGIGGYTYSATSYPGTVSAFTLQLVPQADYADAGGTVTYDIKLTRTKYSVDDSGKATKINTMDIGVGYDSNIVYSVAAASESCPGITIANDPTNKKINITQTQGSSAFDLAGGATITLGTVTFTMPNSDYVTTNGTQGVYPLADFTLQDGSVAGDCMIAAAMENHGVAPKLTQYKSKDYGKNVCAMYATLKVAAPVKCTISDVFDTANSNAKLIEYSTSATYSNHSKAFNIPVSARPEIQITPKAGYKVKSSVALPLTQTNAFGLTSQALSGPQNYYWTLNSTLLGNSVFDADDYIEEISYTVTPYDGYGSQVSDTTSNYTISSTTYTFPTAITHSGYTFAGWKVTKAAEGGSGFKDTTTVYSAGQQISLGKSYGNVIITAQWTANEQTNTYGDGVTQKTPEPNTNPKTAESVTVTVTPPTGKMLTGLSIKNTDNSTIAFTPAVNNQTAATDFTFTQSYTGVTVTPTFGDIGYTVTYDTAGGSAVTAGSYSISDKSYTVTSTVPTRQGYNFTGWKVTAAGSQAAGASVASAYFSADTVYAAGAAVTLEKAYGEVTLTAQWLGAAHEDNTYHDSVTQTSPAVDGAPTNPKTDEKVVVSIPEKTGYSIAAPTVTRKDGNNTAVAVNDNGDSDSRTWAFTQPAYGVDVTPNYTANSYEVTLNGNGGTGGTASITVTYDSAGVGTIQNPARDGYTFAGWYTGSGDDQTLVINADGTLAAAVTGYTGTENSVIVWKLTGNTTLYAHWNGAAQANTLPDTVTASPASPKTGENVTLTVTPPAGYYLSGLTIAKTGDANTIVNYTGTIDTEGKPVTAQTFTYKQPGYGVTVAPTFTGREYTITIPTGDDAPYTVTGSNVFTVTYGSSTISGGPTAIAIKTGYTVVAMDGAFPTWLFVRTSSSGYVPANKTLLIHQASGATTYKLNTADQDYLKDYLDTNGNWKYAGNVDVMPYTVAENYILHFSTNGGTAIKDAKVIYGYSGPNATTTMLTTKTGYYVEGWYLDSGFTTKIANNATGDYAMTYVANVDGYTDADGKWIKDLGTSTDSITFYAKWLPIKGGVYFHLTGSDKFPGGTGDLLEKAYYGDSSVTVTAGDNIVPVKTGYNIAGWTDSTSGTTKYINADGTFVANTKFADANGKWKKTDGWSYDFYPMWVLKTTVVSFNLNYTGAGTNPDSITETFSQTAVSASVPTTGPDGYSFAGWYTAKTGGTKMFKADGSAVTYHWENEDPTMTLYAQWTGTPQTNTALPSTVTATDTTDSTQTYPSIPTGDTVSLSITPAEGYYLSGLTITKTGEPSTTVTYTGTIDTATKPTGAQTFTYQQPAYGVTVTPTFTGRTYTITLSAAGVTHATGLTGTTTLTVIYGSSASFANMPAIGTDTGYAANDLWYAAPNTTTGAVLWGMGGQDNSAGGFAENSVYTSAGSPVVWKHAGNVTLYPGIESKKTTVTLDTNGGTSNGHPYFDATYDATLSGTQIVPTRTGYTFAGWTATKDGTDLVVNAASNSYVACSGVTSSDTPPVWKVDAETYTLYAKWSANSQTVTLPTDNTVAVSSPTTTGTEVTLTVTPPTGKKISTLTVTPTGGGDPIAIAPNTFAADDSRQTFTYTQPASGVTVAVSYENINYAVSYAVPASVTISGVSTSYNVDSTSLTIPGALTRTGFTFDGWTISRTESVGTVNGGSDTVAAGVTSIALNKATGNITLTAKWIATSNQIHFAIKDKNVGANDVGHIGTAAYTVGAGIAAGIGDDAGKYFITADNDATFTVTPKPGYKVTSVTYAVVNDDGTAGTATAITGTGSSYTIPAAACVVPLIVTVNTELDSSKISVNANIADGAFQHYSLYSGTKSLVRIHVDSSVSFTGIAFSAMSAYRTNAYSGYEYAALVDLSKVSDKSQAGLLAYIQSIMEFSSTANTVLEYNKDVNGNNGFKIDDISVEYDYTSYSTLKWVPLDGYLIIGDIANSSNALTSDGVLNAYDVAAFVSAYGK